MSETATRDFLLFMAIILSFQGLLCYFFFKLDAKTPKTDTEASKNICPPRIVAVTHLGSVPKPRKGVRRRFLRNSLFFGITEGVLFSALERDEIWHRFRVRYDTGLVEIVECRDGSTQYYDLIAKI